MRYGVISDVHSNLEALEVVLEALKAEKVDRLLCVGDLVGYGADPGPCLALIRKEVHHTVCGNHDWALTGKLSLEWFNEWARAGLEWTKRHLAASDAAYLNSLSLTWQDSQVTLAHGSVHEPEKFHYVMNLQEARRSLAVQATPVAFIGHTHVPGVFVQEGDRIGFERPQRLTISPLARHLVNVGSVGQPRDGDPRASYCLYDSDSGQLEFRRLTYPVARAQEKIRKAGLPEFLADRLSSGY